MLLFVAKTNTTIVSLIRLQHRQERFLRNLDLAQLLYASLAACLFGAPLATDLRATSEA